MSSAASGSMLVTNAFPLCPNHGGACEECAHQLAESNTLVPPESLMAARSQINRAQLNAQNAGGTVLSNAAVRQLGVDGRGVHCNQTMVSLVAVKEGAAQPTFTFEARVLNASPVCVHVTPPSCYDDADGGFGGEVCASFKESYTYTLFTLYRAPFVFAGDEELATAFRDNVLKDAYLARLTLEADRTGVQLPKVLLAIIASYNFKPGTALLSRGLALVQSEINRQPALMTRGPKLLQASKNNKAKVELMAETPATTATK
jgi:hypothetical protein